MRLLVIGDVHGCIRAWDAMMDQVNPGPEDRVVTLGDYVDRGTDSKAVLEGLMTLREQTRLVPLLGNHDWLFLRALERPAELDPGWLRVGGEETLASYGSLERVPECHLRFLREECLRISVAEADSCYFVHGSAEPATPLEEQTDEWVLWRRVHEQRKPHVSGLTMVCGHTAQRCGLPWLQEGGICVDTWAWGEGWLTCYEVGEGCFHQTNEVGDTRSLSLEEVREQRSRIETK